MRQDLLKQARLGKTHYGELVNADVAKRFSYKGFTIEIRQVRGGGYVPFLDDLRVDSTYDTVDMAVRGGKEAADEEAEDLENEGEICKKCKDPVKDHDDEGFCKHVGCFCMNPKLEKKKESKEQK
jgi:hypothetical protein